MDPEAAKLIGAGLAAIGACLASLGVGNVFAKFLEGALPNCFGFGLAIRSLQQPLDQAGHVFQFGFEIVLACKKAGYGK